ncbi:GDP-L-fucose synthase family protein [Arthrobacter psychrochitiniphilus]|uniref:GDP-L-fucose synthase family protein n=1 Tax=Arthrobacter psychrochitiniphilus TaxID=291045 RepID=UPI003F7C2080
MTLIPEIATNVASEFVPGPLDKNANVYVAGHRGLVGSAIWRNLKNAGHTSLHGQSSADLDLRNRADVFSYMEKIRPEYVILAAAKVGGIMANSTSPVDFLSDNLRIQVNVMDAALRVGVQRLLFLGSSCIYPKFASQPIAESALLSGYLEPSNEAYAVAKIAGITAVKAVRQQYGLPWISAMPTNLYGKGDNFTPEKSHVLPALISRYHHAKVAGLLEVQNWGTGAPRREFLHADDAAAACLHLLEHYDGESHVNVGTGTDISIRDLAHLIAQIVGYEGSTTWNVDKPDGTPQKLLDTSLLSSLGWRPSVSLQDGVSATYSWFGHNLDRLRITG